MPLQRSPGRNTQSVLTIQQNSWNFFPPGMPFVKSLWLFNTHTLLQFCVKDQNYNKSRNNQLTERYIPLRSEMCFKLKGAISSFSVHDLVTLTIHVLQQVVGSDNLHLSGFNARISAHLFATFAKTISFYQAHLATITHSNFPEKCFSGKQEGKEWRNTLIVRNPFFQLSSPNKIPSG